MSKKEKEVPAPSQVAEPAPSTAVATVEPVGVSDLFKRPINALGKPRTLTLKRVLTRPLVSMAKRKQLAVEVQSEMYIMDLPLTGRGGGTGCVRVFDAIELVATETGFKQGDECIVICHELMASALQRAGYAVQRTHNGGPDEVAYEPVAGLPLKGKLLGFITGDIADGKRYRSISVAELE